MIEYLRTHFIFDFLATVPNLITGEEILHLYYLKVFRVYRLYRIVSFMDKFSSLLKSRNMKY